MEKLMNSIKEELKTSIRNYDNQLKKIDEKLRNDDLLKVCLSELRASLFDLFLSILNDKQFKQKCLIITGLQIVLRDSQHWKQDSLNEKDLLINQLLQLIEESIFNQTDSIRIDLLKVLLETSCINANAINFENLQQIINLNSQLIKINQTKLSLSTDCSCIRSAAYTSCAQIIENYILYFNEGDELNNVSIRNGYLLNLDNLDNLDSNQELGDHLKIDKLNKFDKLKNIKLDKLNDKFLNVIDVLINKYIEIDEDELRHFYLNCILICLKCTLDQQNVIIKLDLKLKSFLISKFTDFIFNLLECKQAQKSNYFKLEIKKSENENDNAKTLKNDKLDKKCISANEKLIKVIYLICEELFKILSEFRCLRSTLTSIAFKMFSFEDNQFFILKCINRIFNNHILIFKLFFLAYRNEILVDKSIIELLLDTNKKSYHLLNSANTSISSLASQSIVNVNDLIKSFSKIIQEFVLPKHILTFRKSNLDANERANENLNQDFENYKIKLDNLLSDEDSASDNLDEIDKNELLLNESSNDESSDQLNEAVNDFSGDQNDSSKENTLKFVQYLKNNLPELMKCKNVIKIDDLIQSLSSEFCDQLTSDLIINADGIYASIYCSLSLNYQLFYTNANCDKCDQKTNYLRNCDKRCDNHHFKNEEQFIDEIQKSGLIVFLSAKWIKHLYQQLMKANLFEDQSLILDENLINQPLIKLILDLENKMTYELIDYYKLNLNNEDNLIKLNKSSSSSALKINLINELLDCIWPYLLNNLSFTLRKDLKSIEKSTTTEKTIDQDMKQSNLDLIFKTLELTEELIQANYRLNRTDRCLVIYDLFLSTILKDLDENVNDRPISLNIIQLTAIRIILKYSIQLSCDCPQLWKYLFSCSNYISNIEHKYFTEKLNKSQNPNLHRYGKMLKNLPANLSKKLNRTPRKEDKNSLNLGDLLHNMESLNDFDNLKNVDQNLNSSNQSINLIEECDLNLNLSEFNFDCTDFSIEKIDEYCNNLSSQNCDKKNQVEDNQLIDTIIVSMLKESKLTISYDDCEILINCLCKQSSKLFEDAALRLNLKYLVQFLEQLILNSNRQLYSISNNDKNKHNRKLSSIKIFNYNCLLFDKFCNVIIKIFKSSRPIFHLMKCYRIASEHLIETASFNYYLDKVKKTSITTLNDIYHNFLLNHIELDHFHCNESLFKSYETLLLLELCEIGIQEMIISSINGFVEGFENEIGSGWKCFFRALCGVRLIDNFNIDNLINQDQFKSNEKTVKCINTLTWSEQIECVRQLRVIFDIFNSFLKIPNRNVFNQGAIDCMNCLFKMLKNNNDIDCNLDLDELKSKNTFINLNLISLKCIHQFEVALQKFYSTDNLKMKKAKQHYSITLKTKLINVNYSKLDFIRLLNGEAIEEIATANKQQIMNYLKEDLMQDQQKVLLEHWYIYYYYLHGLSTSIESCSIIDHQAKIISILLSSFNFLLKNIDTEFAIYSINHIAFNCIQNWSTTLNAKFDTQSHESDLILNKIEFANYKHLCIMITNLVVELLKQQNASKQIKGTSLLIYQFYVLFTQLLIDDFNFMISTLSISCLKHVFEKSTKYLNQEQCELIFYLLDNFNRISLRPFQKLIDFFKENEIADLSLVGKLINDQDNLGLESELACQLLMQSYLNNQIELTNTGHLTKLYSFDIGEESFTINKLIKKYRFIDFVLKKVGGLILSGFENDFKIKQFISLDTLEQASNKHFNQQKLITLIDEIHFTFNELDKDAKIKFLLQKISMFKPLINFYQFDSTCFILKFLVYFDKLNNLQIQLDSKLNNEMNNKLDNELDEQHIESELIYSLTKLNEKLIIDYIMFKIERKLIRLEMLNDECDFKNKLGNNQKIPQDDINKKIEKFKMIANQTDLMHKLKTFIENQMQNKNRISNLKDCATISIKTSLDLDTECYLIIYNKLINQLIDLHLNTNARLFIKTLNCFIPLIYYLIYCKNSDDFIAKLYEWLTKLDLNC